MFHKLVVMDVASLVDVARASCILHNICEIKKVVDEKDR